MQYVADQIGCVISAYSRYEHEEREPTFQAMVAMSKLYGVSIEYLAGLPEPKNSVSLTDDENELLRVYRMSDNRAKYDAMLILGSYNDDWDKRRIHRSEHTKKEK